MNLSERKRQLENRFFEEFQYTLKAPRDLEVSKYSAGQEALGSQREQVHYEVVYEDGTDELLVRVFNQDQSLFPINEQLMFKVDEEKKKFIVGRRSLQPTL